MAQIVTGKDLLAFIVFTDLEYGMEKTIDPDGHNVVGLSMMKGSDIKCNMLIKLRDWSAPVERKVTMPISVYTMIVQFVDTDREVMVH